MFLEKVKLTLPCETVFLEDLVGAGEFRRQLNRIKTSRVRPPVLEKLTAWLMAKFLPVGLLERVLSSNRQSAIGNPQSLD